MELGILVIVVTIALSLLFRWQKENRLKSEGKIIDRKDLFYEKAQEFTVALESPEIAAGRIRALPYGTMGLSMREDGQTFQFAGSNFAARLWLREFSDGRGIYQFQFDRWKTSSVGGAIGHYEMNVLLTTIEKLFLSIDQNTCVRTWNLETHTKTKFF